MSSPQTNREATASIKGYIYQFDATILNVLQLGDQDTLKVEDVEDFDVYSEKLETHYQCKYYESKKLTNSLLRDIIVPMLGHFQSLEGASKSKQKYTVYGHFKDTEYGNKSYKFKELQSALVKSTVVKEGPDKGRRVAVNLQATMVITDKDLRDFAKKLTVIAGDTYDAHKHNVVKALAVALEVGQAEATEFVYPSALTVVTELATKSSVTKRTVRKADFLSRLTPSSALFNAWMLKEQGETNYCRNIKQRYFSALNVDAMERFFIIDATHVKSNGDITSLIHQISAKWSTHKSKRKPDKERYAPYIFLNGLDVQSLLELKEALFRQGVKFVDGYPFSSAKFNVEHLSVEQTFQNQIQLRFISDFSELTSALHLLSKSCAVFQFYFQSPIEIPSYGKYISILITSLDMVERII